MTRHSASMLAPPPPSPEMAESPVRPSIFADAAPIDARGRRPPADVLARAVRDHLLRTAADRFCVGMSDRQAAMVLRTKLDRYRLGAWQRDRAAGAQCPDRHRGSVTELLWTILKIRDAVPSDRSIRAALGARSIFRCPRSVI
jgi:hypothetical protein